LSGPAHGHGARGKRDEFPTIEHLISCLWTRYTVSHLTTYISVSVLTM
jgi:hypothetical protein